MNWCKFRRNGLWHLKVKTEGIVDYTLCGKKFSVHLVTVTDKKPEEGCCKKCEKQHGI